MFLASILHIQVLKSINIFFLGFGFREKGGGRVKLSNNVLIQCISDESKVLGKIGKKWLQEVRLQSMIIRLLLKQDQQDKRQNRKNIEIILQARKLSQIRIFLLYSQKGQKYSFHGALTQGTEHTRASLTIKVLGSSFYSF